MQSDNIKNEAEDITKDDYVFSKCVLDCDTCNFNKEALNGCVKAAKLKPQKWSIHCLRLSHGFWKPKPPVVSSTSEGMLAAFLPSVEAIAQRCKVLHR